MTERAERRLRYNMKNDYESYGKMVWRRFRRHRLANVSLVLLILIGGAALFAPVLAPYDPEAIAGPFAAPPSAEFLLGTDQDKVHDDDDQHERQHADDNRKDAGRFSGGARHKGNRIHWFSSKDLF